MTPTERIADILAVCAWRSDCGECGQTGWQSAKDSWLGDGKDGQYKVRVVRFDDNGNRHKHQPEFTTEGGWLP